jgi:MFS family permease
VAFKFIYILMAEILLVGTLVGVGVSRTPVQLAGCVLVGTVALSFGYFSHLFYAVTGSKHRQKGAATHEIILSVGLATGSFGGGALGQWCGIRPVFFVIAGVMVGAIVVQGAILYLGRAGWLSRESKAVREGTPVRAEI